MAANNSTHGLSNQDVFLRFFAGIVLRFIASFATVMNICVLLLLVRLKKNFRNYSYWFQILVLASEDLFNGLASLALTFYDLELFRTSAIACSVILCAFMCCQVNTLLGICCICVNRFRSIQTIDKLREPNMGYQPEIAVAFAALLSILYSILPFLVFPLNSVMPACSVPTLLGSNNVRTYKLLTAFGLIVPLAIINVLYSICLVKLRRVNANIRPVGSEEKSQCITRSPATEETFDVASASKDKPYQMKVDPANSHGQNPDKTVHQENSKIPPAAQVQATCIEACSTSVAADTSGKTGKNQRWGPSRVHASTRETQSRAVKLLGIILFLTNITVIIPVSLLLRGTIRAESDAGGSALGITLLALNSLADAFVYGFYAVEIRKYIHGKIMYIGHLFCFR